MENTLYRAQKNDHIDNLVVGLYIDDNAGKTSLIKVGSWDKIAIEEGHELQMIRCPTDSAWTLEVTSLKFAGKEIIPGDAVRSFRVDPQMPFIYIPNSDFLTFAQEMAALHED